MRAFIFVLALVAVSLAPELAFAAEDGGSAWGFGIGSGLAVGLAILGAGIGQGLTAAGAVQGIADLIIRPGMINVDFADVRTVMSEMGMAMMGSGVASGALMKRSCAAVSTPSTYRSRATAAINRG